MGKKTYLRRRREKPSVTFDDGTTFAVNSISLLTMKEWLPDWLALQDLKVNSPEISDVIEKIFRSLIRDYDQFKTYCVDEMVEPQTLMEIGNDLVDEIFAGFGGDSDSADPTPPASTSTDGPSPTGDTLQAGSPSPEDSIPVAVADTATPTAG